MRHRNSLAPEKLFPTHVFHARARPGEVAAKHHDCGFGNAMAANARALLGGGQSRSHTTTLEAFGEGTRLTQPSRRLYGVHTQALVFLEGKRGGQPGCSAGSAELL